MKHKNISLTLSILALLIFNINAQTSSPLLVKKCVDFGITGKGNHHEWEKTTWTRLSKIDAYGDEQKTEFKVMYSPTGLYVVFRGDDNKITSAYQNDGDDLYDADVFEVFLHPDPSSPMYYEYEISPLEKELILLITNKNGKFSAWLPWYKVEKRTTKKVIIEGGKMENGSPSKSWSAEIFMPYQLVNPTVAEAPKSGTKWNANFCRLDYDSGKMVKFSWSPIKTAFHEFEKFKTIIFE